ncbi:hypothetical protein UG55_106632 [Frankia sp. EI5c]|uniref:hypothetical protein n=1 Tax=Frankia sp. EI5c TaxID=683316 RepID=UPI0007C22D5C|nr:hypothetical protein [Frankia sp. EI5c]OAA20995.1 hypothetical protein UG55_106632 [Frankia sp. EI5c]
MPLSSDPVDAADLAAFGDDARNAAARIRYDIPLPGEYSFQRIVPLDLPADHFVETAKKPGESLAELGVVQLSAGNVVAVSAERLRAYYERLVIPGLVPSPLTAARLTVDGGPPRPASSTGSFGSQPAVGVSPVLPGPPQPAPAPAALAASELASSAALSVTPAPILDAYLDRMVKKQVDLATTGKLMTIDVPAPGLGNSTRLIPVDASAGPRPTLALVETYQVSAFLGDYGLGRTINTFSLLPGERTTIAIRTWRESTTDRQDSTSVFDSSDTAAQERFSSQLEKETSSAFQDQGGWAVSVNTKASASGSLGFVSAKASLEAGFAANHQEARQSFAASVSRSASEHASQVNSARRQAVSSTAAVTTTTGEENSTTREITNTNLRRVLNFVFRELNQTYEVVTVLRSVQLAFFNGKTGSAEIVELAGIRDLLDKHLVESRRAEVGRKILATVAQCLDHTGNAITMLEWRSGANRVLTDWKDAEIDSDGSLAHQGDPLAKDVVWRIKREPLGQAGEPRKVDGVVTSKTSVVLRTDSVIIEALLGRADALDPYAAALQALDLRAREADIIWRETETRRTAKALELVDAADADQKATVWEKTLGDQPDIEIVPLATTNNISH